MHEFGHFFFARRGGMKVEEFGIGLPPRIYAKQTSRIVSIQKNGRKVRKKEKMEWSLNWIFFGGFVKILGEDANEISNDPRDFHARPILSRILFVCGGVLMNFILGFALLSIAFFVGTKPLLLSANDFEKNIAAGIIETKTGVEISEVQNNFPAAKAGLRAGDIILKINDFQISQIDDFIATFAEKKPLAIFNFEISRDEKILNFLIEANRDGLVGIIASSLPPIAQIGKIQLPFFAAIKFGFTESWRVCRTTFTMASDVFLNLIRKFSVPSSVAGPVGIAQITHGFVESGEMIQILVFTAILSLSLAVINILPFPALDGGRLVFLLFEAIFRKKPNPNWETKIHAIGFAFLLALIVLVTWNDLARLFG